MPHINLLPWREQAKQKKQKSYIVILVMVGISALGLMLLVDAYYSHLIANQQMRNQYLQNEILVLDAKIAEIKELKAKRKSLEQRMELIADLQHNRNLAAQVLAEITTTVPAGIFFTELEKKGNSVFITGKSESNNRVSNLMRNAEASYLFELPLLNTIVAAKANAQIDLLSDFKMSVQVKPFAERISAAEVNP
ncbi:PilN domain-containing protein [Catenovulum sp. 2E275]|uniref:PilN domain-containing protein n=1 Tax=Catenovulum sp. 2E275 TaxID=2980497 RepID=UPI0021D32EA5|nr:PilN domain-containing protein [Catenovulum sp. 2E275]MCU4675832.1 PilN domain-containing protein [Catenovulum sp. 2E275]